MSIECQICKTAKHLVASMHCKQCHTCTNVGVSLAELARLRRIEVAYRNEFLHYDAHKGEQWCSSCNNWTHLEATLRHTATCDVAIHLNLPREKGEGE